MYSNLNLFFTKNFSNIYLKINKYIKMPKTQIPFVQSPYQNWTDLGHSGGTGQGVLR